MSLIRGFGDKTGSGATRRQTTHTKVGPLRKNSSDRLRRTAGALARLSHEAARADSGIRLSGVVG
ncbi:MAG TPA: hypothetical protein VG871_15940 [Vicinamibacterales bacterium]|nr:hypothetical protein [Vicinamibacterales bacterium]